MSDMEALDQAIGEYVRHGWDIHQSTPSGVQLKHPDGRSVYLTAEMAKRGERPELNAPAQDATAPSVPPSSSWETHRTGWGDAPPNKPATPEAQEALRRVVRRYLSAGWQ